VASGGTSRIIRKVLERNGLISLFGAIVTSENVSRQKPAPDIFLEAAHQLGVNPLACRAYEDTNLGMQAILAAGMEAVDVRLILAEQSCRDAA
jgi:HAD superfamily hydrolase (TIGR01509 family)